jgi:hypothetical protein
MKEQEEGTVVDAGGAANYSRRNLLKGSALLIAGGVAGRISSAQASTEPGYAPAPPLPWKWTRLDPMEAGTRAYQAYLKQKG